MNNHDNLLFKGTAYYYSRFRRGHPSFFFDYLIKVFNLNNHSRILDLGAGTGQITIPVAKIAKEVVAVDPDQEMLDEGKKQAEKQNINNISWVNATAESLPNNIGFFDLTTLGASFHWMEQDKVLENIYKITNEKGGLVIVSDNSFSIYRNFSNEEWKNVVKKVVEKYLGKRRKAGGSFFKISEDKFEDIINRSKFSNLKIYNKNYMREWTIDQILGFLSSTSFASKRLFGEKIQDFEKDLRSELIKLNDKGIFTEQVNLEALLAWKI